MKSPFRIVVGLVGRSLKLRRRRRPRKHPTDPYILVIRRNRMGDMIYTLPLLHALRRHFPKCHLTVACDLPGAPIAEACEAVDHVIVLTKGWNPWQAAIRNAAELQDYDWVIAAKGGFDRRLAVLTRLTNAAIRIGFERPPRPGRTSGYFTHPVPLPDKPDEHQIETLFRLLQPLGILKTTEFSVSLAIKVPEEAKAFADEVLSHPPFLGAKFVLLNLSSTVRLKFREEDFIALAGRILGATNFAVALVGSPSDQQRAHEIAHCMGTDRIVAVETSHPMELAALMERAAFLVTPEGGAAHLAATVELPALVLWSEGPFAKWYSRGKRHVFVHAERGEVNIPVERVWKALQPFLAGSQEGLDRKWADMLGPTPAPNPSP
jgi:ADP-heptose:LPS heptosyltransferase